MKKIVFFSSMVALLLLASCHKDNRYNNGNYTANLTFWTASNCSPNPITVTINGQNSVMTEFFPTVVPSCGSQGCANFSLGAGSYNYSATNGDTTWTGTVSVDKGSCTLQQLFCATGNVTFWVDSAASNIQVTVDGGSTHITTAFPTTTPTCGTSGCANFTLHPGTYTYTAITSTNIGYTGSVRVGADSCTIVKLY
jgi:major membrane immunogen (membrane-anchored lipoprotein)